MHPDFSSRCHLHLVPPELVAKTLLVNHSVHDPVLCSVKFHLIFITSVLKVIQFLWYSISVFLCIDDVSNFVRSTNLFKTLLHCAKFINRSIKQDQCLRNSIVIALQSNSFLSRPTHRYFSFSHD